MWNKFYKQYSIYNYKKCFNNPKFSWMNINKSTNHHDFENKYLSQMSLMHSYNYYPDNYDTISTDNENDYLNKMSIIHSKK